MSILQAIILGIVQGLTEFLPISSSGHLMLLEGIFGITSGGNYFNVLLHLATLLSVLIVMHKEVLGMVQKPFSKPTLLVLVAMIPTVIVTLFLKFVAGNFFRLGYLGFGFLYSGILILATFTFASKEAKNNLSYKNAILIGAMQGLAVLPGVSRSASTICAGIISGAKKEESIKFSFLLSVPVIIASMVFEVVSGEMATSTLSFAVCFAGAVSAFLSSLLSIRFMLRLARKGNWLWFSAYLILLSFGVLIFTFAF
ncbi:MAG: undecaprenyl-diphosphate phosphatase [Clostridia bacterium]|nr:undecaprenyl-diphosphate phosphatase [Clostridia bacterium]